MEAAQQYTELWHPPKADKTPEHKEDPVLMALSWWHHPCTQQKLRLSSADQKPWLAMQQLYSNSMPQPCQQSAIPRSHPLTIYGVKSSHWPGCPPQPSSVPTALGKVTANISKCFNTARCSLCLCPCSRTAKHFSKQTSRDATSTVNL